MSDLLISTIARQMQSNRTSSFSSLDHAAIGRRDFTSDLTPPPPALARHPTMNTSAALAPVGCVLINWRAFVKRTLRGFATVEYQKLRIIDIPLHVKGETRWVGMPARPLLGPDGLARRTSSGQIQYSPVLEWTTKEAAAEFSRWVIAEVERAHPDALPPE